jgi:hypothetical protein
MRNGPRQGTPQEPPQRPPAAPWTQDRPEPPPVPEHVPEPAGATIAGLTYCMRCGRLLHSAKRGEAAGAAKACRTVRVTFRADGPH